MTGESVVVLASGCSNGAAERACVVGFAVLWLVLLAAVVCAGLAAFALLGALGNWVWKDWRLTVAISGVVGVVGYLAGRPWVVFAAIGVPLLLASIAGAIEKGKIGGR